MNVHYFLGIMYMTRQDIRHRFLMIQYWPLTRIAHFFFDLWEITDKYRAEIFKKFDFNRPDYPNRPGV